MRAWRLTRSAYASDPLSGVGAARAGGRWNSRGIRVGYCCTGRPLALLEMLVHVTRDSVPADLVLVGVDIPDELIVLQGRPPEGWNRLPYSATARSAGDAWVAAGGSLALAVPSVVLPAERNFLVNPLHPEFRRIRVGPIEKFAFDRRLLR